MAQKFKRFIPTFIPLLFEVIRHFRRDSAHDRNIKKFDKSREQLSTIEHLLVKLEKNVKNQRENTRLFQIKLMWWLGINSAILIAIAVKLFFFM
ncbi:MAG TPA: hypothetical protein GX398_00895 [Candidatus Cloacimonetes bacterium]|jgi:hypothetical protein|nr:hypothetical protein [Candidatus Cloacimonadota bacterium]